MGQHREFEIAFVGLKPGPHVYDYEIGDLFFESYQQQEFTRVNARVKLTLDKNPSFLLLKFEVGGKVDVTCDRCGSFLPLDLWDEFNLVVKLVDNPDEMNATEEDPDVYFISRTESHLFVGDWIFEFINLSIPMQRMCSEKEMGGPHCNQEVLEMLKKMDVSQRENSNPLWKGLDQFRKEMEE